MIYKTPSIYKIGNYNKLSLNLNDYESMSIKNDLQFFNGFSGRGTDDEYALFYPDLDLVCFSIVCVKNESISSPNWTQLFTVHSDLFYFDDATAGNYPKGVFGMDMTKICCGVTYNTPITMSSTNKNILLLTYTGNKSIDYKDMYLQITNNGCMVNLSYAVTRK